jgi:hypothetical protein
MNGNRFSNIFVIDRLLSNITNGEKFAYMETDCKMQYITNPTNYVDYVYSPMYTNVWVPYEQSGRFYYGGDGYGWGSGGTDLAYNLYGTLADVGAPAITAFSFSPTVITYG